MIRTRFSGKEYRRNWPCVSSQIRPHDVVGVACGLKLRAGGRKNPDPRRWPGDFILPEREKMNWGRPLDIQFTYDNYYSIS